MVAVQTRRVADARSSSKIFQAAVGDTLSVSSGGRAAKVVGFRICTLANCLGQRRELVRYDMADVHNPDIRWMLVCGEFGDNVLRTPQPGFIPPNPSFLDPDLENSGVLTIKTSASKIFLNTSRILDVTWDADSMVWEVLLSGKATCYQSSPVRRSAIKLVR
ncbi:MAG: hypothetical protein HY053_01380 [Proteobacteria bacterium]|nr:hypothetical protein [Pseudomonadota bacterium]